MNNSSFETLFEKVEDSSKTSIELIKLRMIEKSAEMFSSFVKQIAFYFMLALITIVISIGIALWLGDLLGKLYYGFFALSLVYAFLVLMFRPYLYQWIKVPVSNFIITQLLK